MKRYLPLLLAACLVVAFRIVSSQFPETLPNFQPLTALFFCGAFMLTGWRAIAIPMAIWAVTFPFGSGHSTSPVDFLSTTSALLCVFFLGKQFARTGSAAKLGGSAIAALVFHLITCTVAWLVEPFYAKTLTGLSQSLWYGPAGSPLPSWVFLRNMAAANVLFTAIILLGQARLPRLTARKPVAAATTP